MLLWRNSILTHSQYAQVKLLFLIWVLELCRPKKPWEVMLIAAEGLWSRGVRCSFGWRGSHHIVADRFFSWFVCRNERRPQLQILNSTVENFNDLFVLFVSSQLGHSECHAFCARAVSPPRRMQKGKPSLVLSSCTPLMQAHCVCPTVVLTRWVEENYLLLNPMPCSSLYRTKENLAPSS